MIAGTPHTSAAPKPPHLPSGVRTMLAPLCGISTAAFRRICLRHGADMAVTEMVSSEAVTRGKREDCRAMRGIDMRSGPQSLQIFGGDAHRMGETAARLSEEFEPVYLDMNFGCPVKKIVRGGGGSAVLRDTRLLGRICSEVVSRSAVPVSAKIRAGWDRPSGEHVREIARIIEDAGVSMIAVHARTRKQAFAGRANWDLIREVKESVTIPVVGNGDIRDAADAAAMRDTTRCDAVMIGRGAIGNPWIFAEVKAAEEGVPFIPPTPRERVETLIAHAREAVLLEGEPLGLINMRRLMAAYVKHLPNARDLRGTLMQIESLESLEEVLMRYADGLEGAEQ